MSLSVKIDGQVVEVPDSDTWTKAGVNKPIANHQATRGLLTCAPGRHRPATRRASAARPGE
jgi:hypothetical protein